MHTVERFFTGTYPHQGFQGFGNTDLDDSTPMIKGQRAQGEVA